MPKREKTPPNISISDKNLKLLERQQEFFPLLTKGELVNNILNIYFKGSGSWVPKKVDDEEEYNPKDFRGKKNSTK